MPLFPGPRRPLGLLDTASSPSQHLQVYDLLAARVLNWPRRSVSSMNRTAFGARSGQEAGCSVSCTLSRLSGVFFFFFFFFSLHALQVFQESPREGTFSKVYFVYPRDIWRKSNSLKDM